MSWYGRKKADKLALMDKSRILVFDVETTGLNATLDEIIQISILDGYGMVLFSSYIKPARHKIWTEAQRVNGIRYAMIKDAPRFKEVKKEIQGLFNNAKLLVGYNIGFDIGFLEAAGIIVGGDRFDVMTEFSSYRAEIEHTTNRRCKLIECAEFFDYTFDPHDAEADAKATLHCFDSLLADPRFTTYKRKDKEQQISVGPSEKKHTRFTIAFRRGFFQTVLSGIVISVIGIGGFLLTTGINSADYGSLMTLISYIVESLLNNRIAILFSVISIIGLMMVIIPIMRKIILLPRAVIVHLQRLFK